MTDKFICPNCGLGLTLNNKSLSCENNHCFDLAKQGYVHLIKINKMHSKSPGDTKEMVDSRRSFLGGGHYDIFSNTLCGLVEKYGKNANFIVDAGCGEGFYTNNYSSVTSAQIIGFDISKFAVKAAAGAYKQIDFAVASCFDIPIQSESCDLLVNVFSPMAESEFSRIMKSGAYMIYAVPGQRHLFELKEALYENPYENELKDVEYDGFEFLKRITVQGVANLTSSKEIWDLFCMTPYYWKTDINAVNELKKLEKLDTHIHFDFLIYKKI